MREAIAIHEGKLIGNNYRILRELGRGGEGKVYLVQHMITEQLRAAKLLERVAAGKDIREIQAMKRLEHPSLPQVFDVLTEDGRVWLILEYVRGRCLHEIPGTEVTAEQFFLIAGQLAEVLVYLHSRKVPVFHLDIKPSNLILCSDGRLVLIDFGAAVRRDVSKRQKEYLGTPGYAAPEQIQGILVDCRSDIYGAGAVLYYYLFRITPEKGGRVAEEIVRMEKNRTKKGGRIWKKDVLNILENCLQKNPSLRFQNAETFQKAVRRAAKNYKYRKKAKSVLYTGILGGIAVTFMMSQMIQDSNDAKKRNGEKQKQEAYSMLMEQAEQSGLEQAAECYEKAVFLLPGNTQWLEKLLERITADYSFSLEEERVLKKLLYLTAEKEETGFQSAAKLTVLELLRQEPGKYGAFACKMGIMYWYYYEESGGRHAASEWFEEAVNAGEQEEKEADEEERKENDWLKRARIYAKIGGYYEKLGKADENGILQANMATYWNDISMLWKMDGREQESQAVQRQIAEELLSCMLFHVFELKEAGKAKEEFEKILNELQMYERKNPDTELKESCKAAAEAVERAYQTSDKIGRSDLGLNS